MNHNINVFSEFENIEANPETWACTYCSYENLAITDICEVCNNRQVKSAQRVGNKPVENPEVQKGKWYCDTCTFENQNTEVCDMCETPKPKTKEQLKLQEQKLSCNFEIPEAESNGSVPQLKQSQIVFAQLQEAKEEAKLEEMESPSLVRTVSTEERRAAKEKSQGNEFCCTICYEGFEEGDYFLMQTCPHFFHKECLTEYVQAAIKDMKLTIVCPEASCGVEMHQVDIKDSITEDEFKKYEGLVMDKFVHEEGILKRCPTADCPFIFDPADETVVKCPFCTKEYCLKCKNEAHQGISCEEAKNLDKVHGKEELATAQFFKNSKMVQCDKCKSFMALSGGCNKIKCRCGYRFCYVCKSPNAQCEHTPANHGFIDNVTGRGDFNNLRGAQHADSKPGQMY